MHDHGILIQALVYLASAALFVPLFKRLGLGSVLGYLVAGIAIGPWGLRLITESEVVRQVSEFGVVLLLFLVGLELNPERLWSLRRSIFGLGTLQVAATIGAIALAARGLGADWAPAWVFGMAAAMSSTAIALQILAERRQLNAPPGQAAFAVSLFQDLAVIPLLLVLALLAPEHGSTVFSWEPILTAAALIAGMVAAGRLLLRPLLRVIAKVGMREIFIAFALLLIVGSAALTQSVGLSLGLGSFIAGVLLADSEYRMELEVDIDPFKGLLLGLFFIAVGMSIDIGLILAEPLKVFALAAAAVAIKFVVLRVLGGGFRLCREDGWVFGLALSQIGEFAFVLVAQAQSDRVLDAGQAALANAVVAVSMLSTPLLFVLYARFVAPRYARVDARAPDVIEERNAVIVAGMGRFGQMVVRLLTARGTPVTVIDHDPNQVEVIGRFGWRTYYGDARRPDVLEAAGIAQATLCVLAMDDPAAVLETARHLRHEHPGVQVIARARGRPDAYELERLGVQSVRETLGSALDAAERALRVLGEDAHSAHRTVETFRAHDQALFEAALALTDDDEAQLIALASQGRRELERLLATESGRAASEEANSTSLGPMDGAASAG
jgi:monovalent cation:proton antiporter-2 (CPA2) family protein